MKLSNAELLKCAKAAGASTAQLEMVLISEEPKSAYAALLTQELWQRTSSVGNGAAVFGRCTQSHSDGILSELDLAFLSSRLTDTANNTRTINERAFSLSAVSQCTVEALISQYSVGTPSACSICAVEAALQVLSGADINCTTATDAVKAAMDYQSAIHLDVYDVLSKVDRYNAGVRTVKELFSQPHEEGGAEFTTTQMFKEMQCAPTKIVACVVVRPPETVMVARIGDIWVLFDSHSRPNHQNAAFILFESRQPHAAMAACHKYLDALCSSGGALDVEPHDEHSLELGMLNSMEVYMLELGSTAFTTLPWPNFQTLLDQQRQKLKH